MPDDGAAPSSFLRTLGWGAYLGISWTWCIGMFLPILLIRDFGPWAFAVFAIPNVVGAAAMGWVLRSRADVVSIWETHRAAVRSFTFVTILFHCFFLGWIAWSLTNSFGEWPPVSPLVTTPAVGAVLLLIRLLVKRGRDLIAAAVVWAISLALGAAMLKFGAWDAIRNDHAGLFRGVDPSLAFLAPVCVFGFLLCPYLDATFLRARYNLDPRPSKIAFGVGFGGFFFSMILLTLGYSAALEPGVRPNGEGPAPVIGALLFAHFMVQAFFTLLVHVRALPGGEPRPRAARVVLPIAAVIAVLAGLFIGFFDIQTLKGYAGLALGEVVYRGFMSFYGLVFPAYAWICMIPTRDGHAGASGPRGRRKLSVLAIAIALAAPCFWMGFIERQTWWLAPGLGIVLAARLVVMRTPPPSSGDNAAGRAA